MIGQSGYFIFGFIKNRFMYAYVQMPGLGGPSVLGPSENQARVGQARVFHFFFFLDRSVLRKDVKLLENVYNFWF